MNQIKGQAPSLKAQGSEGIKSSIDNSTLENRHDLEISYRRGVNELQSWFIANGYNKLLQLNPAQLYKEQVAYCIRKNNSFTSPATVEIIFKSIWQAVTKCKRIIQNLNYALNDKNFRGDL